MKQTILRCEGNNDIKFRLVCALQIIDYNVKIWNKFNTFVNAGDTLLKNSKTII